MPSADLLWLCSELPEYTSLTFFQTASCAALSTCYFTIQLVLSHILLQRNVTTGISQRSELFMRGVHGHIATVSVHRWPERIGAVHTFLVTLYKLCCCILPDSFCCEYCSVRSPSNWCCTLTSSLGDSLQMDKICGVYKMYCHSCQTWQSSESFLGSLIKPDRLFKVESFLWCPV